MNSTSIENKETINDKELEELYKKAREAVIEERVRQEHEVSNWYKEYCKLDEQIKDEIDLPTDEEITLRTLIPEIYKNKRNRGIYLEQLKEAQELFERVEDILVRFREDAANEILEFINISKGGK